MDGILQQLNALFQQVQAWFPAIPPSMLIFFAILAGFVALALALLLLRLFWAILTFPFGRRRRRADPERQRRARLKALRQQHHWEREDKW